MWAFRVSVAPAAAFQRWLTFSEAEISKIPYFPCLSGNLIAESGSQQTASSAKQSGMFPYILEKR